MFSWAMITAVYGTCVMDTKVVNTEITSTHTAALSLSGGIISLCSTNHIPPVRRSYSHNNRKDKMRIERSGKGALQLLYITFP